MVDKSDQTLLQAYVRNRCEASFSELVHRNVDLVHSAAVRIVRDVSLAEDVTQRVFLALAQHSPKLQGRTSVTGWLHETARNLAINTVRSEERRRQREQQAVTMNQPDLNDSEALWQQIAPCLDDALAQLSTIERDLILWRYFERRTAEQIGSRLGLTAEAAQKRATRALDRLRAILTERGAHATTASLAALLCTQAVQCAPMGLAGAAIAVTSSASTLFPVTSALQIAMASVNTKIGLAAVLAVSVATPLVLQHQTSQRLRDEIAQLRSELAVPPPQPVPSDASELERLRREHEELMRLRSQVTQLREQLAHQPKVPANASSPRRDNAEDRAAVELENARTLLAKSPDIPMIHRNEFRNAAYATSLDSFHTMNWAAATRDTNAMFRAIGLEPEARARADELFAQMPEAIRQKYSSVDGLLVDWRMNLAEPPEAYRVLSQREEGPDAAILTVQFQYPNSRVRENDLSFYRDAEGVWRQAMPHQVMDKLPFIANSLISQAQPQAGSK